MPTKPNAKRDKPKVQETQVDDNPPPPHMVDFSSTRKSKIILVLCYIMFASLQALSEYQKYQKMQDEECQKMEAEKTKMQDATSGCHEDWHIKIFAWI